MRPKCKVETLEKLTSTRFKLTRMIMKTKRNKIVHKCVSKGVISRPWFTHLGRILLASTKLQN